VRITRRCLIKCVAGAAALSSKSSARAQGTSRRRLIGCLDPGELKGKLIAAFQDGLKQLGYIEGRDYNLAIRSASGHLDQMPKVAAELAELKPDVIITDNTGGAIAATKAAPSVPVVSAVLANPQEFGLVQSYARPGGNVTGILTAVEGLNTKAVEIARELIPNVKTVGLLVNATNTGNKVQRRDVEGAAGAHGIDIVAAEIRALDDLEGAFNVFSGQHVPVFIALRDSLTTANPARVVELAAQARLPGIYGFREFVEAGGLISYGINLTASWHRMAALVDKIFKGEQVGNIPVEFPTKIEMLINLKTAQALGLDMPKTLLTAADEVIE
jgi:putative tryptophan/tyrosine transport system substrate-binding protein